MNICQICESEFTPHRGSKGIYCSTGCAGRSRIGKSFRPITAVSVNCKECQKEFKVWPSIIKNGGGLFCGSDCSAIFNGRVRRKAE